MKYLGVVAAAVIAVLCLGLPAEAQINEGFDYFQVGVRPRGWGFDYCGQNSNADMDYFGANAPSVRMDVYGARITTIPYDLDGAPGDSELSFYLRALAANPSSALLVREWSGESASWVRLTWIENIPASGSPVFTMALNASSSQQVEFTYKNLDSSDDLFLDDVVITNVTIPAPTPAPPIGDMPDYLVIDWDDYSGDGASDIAVYRPSTGEWNILGVTEGLVWGGEEYDVPVPGDYNGDGAADVGYFDRATGNWYVLSLTEGVLLDGERFGSYGDVPVPGDYNGDGTTDLATWRPSDGRWRIRDITNVWFGQAAGMIPVPGDYDGDGTTDIAILDPAASTWYVRDIRNRQFWFAGAVPLPMDYTGDGTTELGMYRPATGAYLAHQLDGVMLPGIRFGVPAESLPFIGDFAGDGTAELGSYRWTRDKWWIRNTQDSTWSVVDFNAQSTDDIVVGAPGY